MTFEGEMNEAVRTTTESLTAIFGEATPATVFSEPLEVGDDIILTAAAWDRAGGFGFGAGGGGEGSEAGAGGGGGGGGVSEGRPVAVIRISAGGVQVEPVVDLTKVAVTGLLAVVGIWKALR